MRKNIKALLLVVLALTVVFSLVACGHQHTFDSAWQSNETHHWQAATCKHDVKNNEAEHKFNAAGRCSVCNYTKPHTCTFEGEWQVEATATMLQAGSEYRVCSDPTCNLRETRTVAKVAVASIAITAQPTKLQYAPGESFDATGMVVTATGADNSTLDVTTLVTLDKTGALTVEDTKVVVSWEGKTAEIAITVAKVHVCVFEGEWSIDKPATIYEAGLKSRACQGGDGCNEVESETIPKVEVVSIFVKEQPTKTSYNAGELFESAGLVIVANGNDGSETVVTASVSFDKVMLTKQDTSVVATFLDKTATVPVSVQGEVALVTVSQARKAEVGSLVLVSGYYVGLSDNGPTYSKEILLKDVATDNIIAVKALPDSYGTWPNIGYQKGDLVRIWGTVAIGDETNTPNKKVVEFATDSNPANINDTIVSTGHKVTYKLDNVVVLDSWDDWQSFFNASTAQTYTYVKLKGTVYSNRYLKGSDGIHISRVHANPSGSEIKKLKPDGTRSVSIRDNILTANVGEDALAFFGSSTSYPGSTVSADEITCIFTGANPSYFQLTILDMDWFYTEGEEPEDDGTWTNADALVEVANAYLRQNAQIRYDQYYQRRHINISPEEATAQNILYLDCSSFVNAVYYETFGVNILPYGIYDKGGDAKTGNFRNYARDFNGKAADVVGYWKNEDYPTETEQDALLAQIKANLQVGDVLNYRHVKNGSEGGHVYIYIGNDQFIHCTGSSYVHNTNASTSYDKGETSSGSVQLISASMLFDRANSGQNRYLFFKSSNDETVDFGVIRPFARNLTPTAETVARMANKGLDVEKTVTEGVNSAVYKDGTITYTLKIANKSTKSYKAVPVKEILDSDVTFVEASATHRLVGNELSFAVDVAAGKTVTITWTVKVNANAAKSALVESNNTTVGGVTLATTVNTVSGYTKAQMESVAAKAKEYVTLGTTFESPLAMAKQLYKDVLGVTLFDYTNVADIMDDLFVKQVAGSKNTILTTAPQLKSDAEIFKMIPYGMYGGYDVSWLQWRNNEQVRLITTANVSLGDVIVAVDGSTTRVFIYVGGMEVVVIDSTTNTCSLVTMTSSPTAATHVLVTLPSYDTYAVLRPSIVA